MSDEVKNWMHLFRWIVKHIRDEYGVDEGIEETTEEIIETVGGIFGIVFPSGTLNEVFKLQELCLLSAWMHGLYKQPEFLGDSYVASCRAANPRTQ